MPDYTIISIFIGAIIGLAIAWSKRPKPKNPFEDVFDLSKIKNCDGLGTEDEWLKIKDSMLVAEYLIINHFPEIKARAQRSLKCLPKGASIVATNDFIYLYSYLAYVDNYKTLKYIFMKKSKDEFYYCLVSSAMPIFMTLAKDEDNLFSNYNYLQAILHKGKLEELEPINRKTISELED